MKRILGKSDGTTLKNHAEMVSKISVMIYDVTTQHIDNKIRETIRIAGLLHDIGKCTNFFQSKLHKSVPESIIENEQPKKYPFRHNEVGYAFLYNHLINTNSYNKKLILDAVYWHHGVTPDNFSKNTPKYKNDIIISPEDIRVMISFTTDVLNDQLIDSNPAMVYTNFNRPDYFIKFDDLNDDINQTKLLIRNCIISADRIVSMGLCDGLTDDEIFSLINTFNNKQSVIDIMSHQYYVSNPERFIEQVSIANSILTDNANGVNAHTIKAPAGFGKSLLTLLWFLQRNKRLIWVCPRNDIAESVYKAILNELKGFTNGLTVSVELYLGGEVIEKNNNNHSEFDSDIIVTNIDNFLNPTVDSRYAHRLFTVIESDVVFDEYHELVSDAALFSLFVNMMRLRTSMTKSSTVLLSATPIPMEFLWDSLDCKTKILPNPNEHFKPQHDKQYLIRVLDNFELCEANTSSLTILNSVSNAQRLKTATNTQNLYHSHFITSDRKRIMSKIFELYGKESEVIVNKPNVISTHVLQASLDLSFKNVTESVLSPETTIQRLGRCNRWGEFESGVLSITRNFLNGIGGENNVRSLLYNINLTNMWFDYMKPYNNKFLTLEQLYRIYNQFNADYANQIKNHLLSRFIDSSSRLAEIYPIKRFTRGNSGIKTAGGNKLRSVNGDEIFVIARYYNDINRYSDPISVNTYNNFTNTFSEDSNQYNLIINQFKKLRSQGDDRFDYNNILAAHDHKQLTLDHIRHHAKKENTPYIRFDKVYHPEYGFVNPNILE